MLEGLLVRQERIEARVQPVRVDLLRRDAQKIVQRRAAVPRVLDVEFAGRFT